MIHTIHVMILHACLPHLSICVLSYYFFHFHGTLLPGHGASHSQWNCIMSCPIITAGRQSFGWSCVIQRMLCDDAKLLLVINFICLSHNFNESSSSYVSMLTLWANELMITYHSKINMIRRRGVLRVCNYNVFRTKLALMLSDRNITF